MTKLQTYIKFDPTPIISAHWKTLVDASNNKRSLLDYVLFIVPSIVVLGLVIGLEITLSNATAAALLTISGLLSAFLFGAVLQIYARAADLQDAGLPQSPALSAQARNIGEVEKGNGVETEDGRPAVLLMVIRRVYFQTTHSLLSARTGARP